MAAAPGPRVPIDTAVVCDGQSLVITPAGYVAGLTYWRLLAAAVHPTPVQSVAQGGQGWSDLAADAVSRWDAVFAERPAATNVLVMFGGQADIVDEGETGQQAYDQAGDYADLARANGFDHVIALTMPPLYDLSFVQIHTTATNAYNAALVADAGGFFPDGVVELDISSTSPLGTPYFQDGVHLRPLGSARAVTLTLPVLTPLL